MHALEPGRALLPQRPDQSGMALLPQRHSALPAGEDPATVNGSAALPATAAPPVSDGRADAPCAPSSNLEPRRARSDAPYLFPRVIPLTTAEQMRALDACARADNHGIIAPTHLVLKDGEIVGYGSICAVPMINVWLHSKKVSGRESLMLLNLAENLAAMAGHKLVCMPCGPESPFAPYMAKMGYQSLGLTTMNLKNLKS